MNPETLNSEFERVQRRAYRLARRLMRTSSSALREGDVRAMSEALMTGWTDRGYAPSPNRHSLVSLVWCAGTVAAHGLARQAKLQGPASWSVLLQSQYLEHCREYLRDVVCELWSRKTGESSHLGDGVHYVVVLPTPPY